VLRLKARSKRPRISHRSRIRTLFYLGVGYLFDLAVH